MIYKKNANFPYPLLTNNSASYRNGSFLLDVELQENTNNYKFNLKYNIESNFISKLIRDGQASLILVIQSRDNKFYPVKGNFIEIPKSRISLIKRTHLQLLIQSKGEISFKYNDDLSDFYQEFREEIIVPKNSLLGFSNLVTFDGSITKPLELFEKKVDPNIKSDIKIDFGNETIIIIYKNQELQFRDLPSSSSLNNTYIYMGLQKALYRFVLNNGDEGEVNLQDINIPEDLLDFKLYNLMKEKMVQEVTLDNIDEVIYSISDKILEKYMTAVRSGVHAGN